MLAALRLASNPAHGASIVSMTSFLLVAASAAFPQDPKFHAPVRMLADGKPISVEAPGYASPCWADVDGDGKKDLLVGQFHKGKVAVHRGLGDGVLAARAWLEAGGVVAEFPDVW